MCVNREYVAIDGRKEGRKGKGKEAGGSFNVQFPDSRHILLKACELVTVPTHISTQPKYTPGK
jgi:hypothetical protein